MSGTCENNVEITGNEQEDVIAGYKTLDEFTKDGYKSLMEAIRNSNSLPSGSFYNYYSTNEVFKKIISEDANNLTRLMNSVLRYYDTDGNIRSRSLDEKTELIVEANDNILERVAINIDDMNGIRKTNNEPLEMKTVSAELPRINGSWNKINDLAVSVVSSIGEVKKTSHPAITLLTAKNIIRPQTFFKDKINNSSAHPWEPRIKEKPNSLKPLSIFLEETENGEEYTHPYHFELDLFEPLPEQLIKEDPIKPLPVTETSLIEVTEPHQVDELVESLRNCKHFAVDLEHHSYRTFMGITCLMQISTTTTDYIIDTLALRDKLYVLNEVFTKPTIVKIFHGADMDIKWLQRDLSLYVVNLFDTHQAAKQLGFSALSLAYLMNRYCNFVPNKQFQLADWRIRPLPDELKKYAREDTHYLIYIYQMLKNELIEKANGQTNLLKAVIKKSTEVAKTRYFKPVLREDSYMDFYRKCKRIFDNRQLYALKELYRWRDEIARAEDESIGYVLPNHMLLQIAEALPREMQGILACCNPIPPLVRGNLLDLHKFILKARDQPLEKPIFLEDTRARGTTKKMSKINVDSPLHCPHDLSKTNEFRDDLPVLLKNNYVYDTNILNQKLEIESDRSLYSIFNSVDDEIVETENEVQKKLQSIHFLGPFERYKLVKPFIQEQEKKEEASKQEEMRNESADTQNPSNERTDEERIESIRNHFLELSRLTVSAESGSINDRTLVQMGGSKKRKRGEYSPEENAAETEESNLQTYIPIIQNSNKRKSNECHDELGFKKLRFDKNNTLNKKSNRRKKKKKKPQIINQTENQNADGQMPNETTENPCSNNSTTKTFKKRNRNRGRNSNHNQNQNNSGSCYVEDTFQPFDYSSVDFNQFQGGAVENSGQKFFKSSFKPKGKKRGGNRGNKSTTFGSVKKGTEYGR